MAVPGSGISPPRSASRSRLGAAPLSTSTMSGPSSRRRSRWGRISLALATAIQFDAVMRQKDVVGEWEPIPEGEARGPASCSTAGAE